MSLEAVLVGYKRCRACTEIKPVDAFWRHVKSSDGRCGSCSVCMLAVARANRSSMRYRVRKVYGLTLEEYDARKAEVTCCPICKRDEELHLDHNADTGKVRNFICKWCNMALGLFQHKPEVLIAAAEYLKVHNE